MKKRVLGSFCLLLIFSQFLFSIPILFASDAIIVNPSSGSPGSVITVTISNWVSPESPWQPVYLEREGGHYSFAMVPVSDEKGTPMGDIADRWSMHMSNLTKVVNSLLERGFVTKKCSDDDKRIKLIFLTVKGRRKREKYIGEFEKLIDESLDKADEDSISSALEAIKAVLGAIQGEK